MNLTVWQILLLWSSLWPCQILLTSWIKLPIQPAKILDASVLKLQSITNVVMQLVTFVNYWLETNKKKINVQTWTSGSKSDPCLCLAALMYSFVVSSCNSWDMNELVNFNFVWSDPTPDVGSRAEYSLLCSIHLVSAWQAWNWDCDYHICKPW